MSTSWGSNKKTAALQWFVQLIAVAGLAFMIIRIVELNRGYSCRKHIVYGGSDSGARLPKGFQYTPTTKEYGTWYDEADEIVGYSSEEDSWISNSVSCIK